MVVNSDLEPDNGRTYPPGEYLLTRGLYGGAMLLPSGTTAIGFELFSIDPLSPFDSGFLTVSFTSQTPPFFIAGLSVPTHPSPQRSFAGVISDTAIDNVSVGGRGSTSVLVSTM